MSSASPTTPQAKALYGNVRAQLWWEFRLALQQGHIDTSSADNRMELEAQLLMPRYLINKGKIMVEPKEDIKKRLGRSPDNADALMYATYQTRAAGIARVLSPSTQSLGSRLPRSASVGGSGGFAPRLIHTGRH